MAIPSTVKAANTFQRPGIPVALPDGTTAYAEMVVPVAATGTPAAGGVSNTYQLASAQTLAAGANTTPVTIPAGNSASYGWDYVFGGTSPSLKLQSLGADGTTWLDVATVTASGQQGVVIFTGSGGAQVRLLNAGANSITGLSSRLTS